MWDPSEVTGSSELPGVNAGSPTPANPKEALMFPTEQVMDKVDLRMRWGCFSKEMTPGLCSEGEQKLEKVLYIETAARTKRQA